MAASIDVSLIAQQVQQDTANWFRQFSTLHKTNQFNIWCSTHKDPSANGLVQLTISHADEVLTGADDLVNFLNEQTMPFVWVINKHDEINLVSDNLTKKGFIEEVSYLMMHDLTHIYKKPIPRLLIKPIENSQAASWLALLNESFGEYDRAFTHAHEHIIRKAIERNEKKYFAGYIDNQLVAIGEILIYSTHSYIHSIATNSAYRGCGIASHLVSHLLEIAQQNGSKYALLDAGSAASLYEKIGFTKIMQLHEFVYIPKSLMQKGHPDERPYILFKR